jgi:hypothetical protein
VIARSDDEFAPAQTRERGVNGAFGKSSCIGERPQTDRDGFPFRRNCSAIEIQINQIGGRLLIVADQITHENVEDVVVDWNGLLEPRHDVDLTAIPINGQHFLARKRARVWT